MSRRPRVHRPHSQPRTAKARRGTGIGYFLGLIPTERRRGRWYSARQGSMEGSEPEGHSQTVTSTHSSAGTLRTSPRLSGNRCHSETECGYRANPTTSGRSHSQAMLTAAWRNGGSGAQQSPGPGPPRTPCWLHVQKEKGQRTSPWDWARITAITCPHWE